MRITNCRGKFKSLFPLHCLSEVNMPKQEVWKKSGKNVVFLIILSVTGSVNTLEEIYSAQVSFSRCAEPAFKKRDETVLH